MSQKHLFLLVSILCFVLFGVYLWWWKHSFPRHYFILPHFVITPEKLESLWKDIANQTHSTDPTFIIISPDHFSAYKTNQLSYNKHITTLCIQWYCHASQGALIPDNWLSINSLLHNNTLILQDHGIGAHLRFIKKWFPDSKVIPVLVQPRSFQNIDDLISQITELSKLQETILIGSVDRSHYVPEPRANLHDITSWNILNDPDSSAQEWKNLDVDCPSCLWIVDQSAKKSNLSPSLFWRDSSAEIFGTTGVDNTSRLAIEYISKWEKKYPEKVITLLFAQDSIVTSWVTLTNDLLQKNFHLWYQNYDLSQNPLFSFHRLWASMDMVWVQIIDNNSDPEHETLMSNLKSLWFQHITTHPEHEASYLKVVRGQTLDIQSNNLIDNNPTSLKQVCKNIKQSLSLWYYPINSVQRSVWNQNQIRDTLIWCGAKLIIWHNGSPDLEFEYYDTIPVIYSLWTQYIDHTTVIEPSLWMVISSNGQAKFFNNETAKEFL